MNTKHIRKEIIDQGLLPLFYHHNAETVIGAAAALYHSGFRVIEFTNRGPAALDNFIQLKAYQKENLPDLILGAGTITTSSSAERFISAGADFIVSPGISEEVAGVANYYDIAWIPGCLT